MTSEEPESNKRPKREYLAFRGRREPRVGSEFQATLPPPSHSTTNTTEKENQTEATRVPEDDK